MTYEEEQEEQQRKRKSGYSNAQSDRYRQMQKGYGKLPDWAQGIKDFFTPKKKEEDEEQE
jgi:hypothetical protein